MTEEIMKMFLKAKHEREEEVKKYYKKTYNLDVKKDTIKFINVLWKDILNIWKSIENKEEIEIKIEIVPAQFTVKEYNKLLKTNVITVNNGENYDILYSEVIKTFKEDNIEVYINSSEESLIVKTTRKHIDELMDIATKKLIK